MRNLKKILALVLALMMALSVMVFASAANYDDYSDKDQISEEYAEAVEVLTGMDIFWGSENSFYPKSNVTRAEVATLLYRIMTTDVSGSQVGIYKDYGMFDDVLETNWFAGYVNFAANSEYVVGVGDGKFNPEGDVTGYEWITMLLRAVGYDANGEISGSEWKITAARLAKQAGILGDFNETTLNSALTREEVAYLLFNAINVPQVDYTPAFGYDDENVWGIKNPTIGEDQFDLTENGRTTIDAWGRPGYTWTYSTGNKVTIIEEAPTVTYTTPVTECDIAAAVGFSDQNNYDTYVNGAVNASRYIVQATDVVTRLGAQGRVTEVYGKDRIVMIDTMLALVTNVTETKSDAAGHLYQKAALYLDVYDGQAPNSYTSVILYSDTNWTYTTGQMLLVNAVTNAAGVNGSHTSVTANNNRFRMHVEIVDVATSFVGAQTVIHYNDGKHTVNGVDYNDANCFHLDQAGIETVNHNWWLDQYGNLIGATNINTVYTYGTIKSIQWQNPNMASGYAQATIVYMDGSEQNATIATIQGYNTAYNTNQAPGSTLNGNIYVSTNIDENYAAFGGAHMYQIETNADGSLDLVMTNHLNNASVQQNISVVTGTPAGTYSGTFYTNSATQYLVKSGSGATATYTPVTGYTNIATYSSATVDYAVVDANGFARYVYITGTPDNATGSGLFYLTTNSYREVLAANNTVDYYELTGYVDGVAGTIKVANVTVKNAIIGNVGRMFIVNYTNGEVTSLGNSSQPISNFVNLNGVTGYADQYIRYVPADSATKVVLSNGVLQIVQSGTTDAYNVVGQVNILGSMPADGNITDKNVHVVYRANGTQFEAVQVYISDKAPSGSSGVQNPNSATVNYFLNVQDSVSGQVTTYTATEVLSAGNPLLGTSTSYTAAWAVSSVQSQNGITFGTYSVVGINAYTETLNIGDVATFVFTIRV